MNYEELINSINALNNIGAKDIVSYILTIRFAGIYIYRDSGSTEIIRYTFDENKILKEFNPRKLSQCVKEDMVKYLHNAPGTITMDIISSYMEITISEIREILTRKNKQIISA